MLKISLRPNEYSKDLSLDNIFELEKNLLELSKLSGIQISNNKFSNDRISPTTIKV